MIFQVRGLPILPRKTIRAGEFAGLIPFKEIGCEYCAGPHILFGVSELMIRILIGIAAIAFIFASLFLTRPDSSGGRLARKLCIGNAVGWLLFVPLSTKGHPPAFLIPGILFWLINLVLLPAAFFALRTGHKEREEKISFVAVAAAYIALNLAVLYVVPLVWLLSEAFG
jgi:hypothetical protein